MTYPLEAVLWDLDGTVVDSESCWIASEIEIAADHGAVWDEADGLAAIGTPIPRTAEALIRRGVRATVDHIVEELLARMREKILSAGVPFRPGVPELLANVQAAGIRQGLVTMSFGGYVDAIVEATSVFDVIRTGDTVERGKPDPQIYRDAMGLLGLGAQDCLAIEDSPSGVGAILAAGVTPVAVPFMVDLPEEERLVRLPTLAGVDVDRLAVIHQEWQSAARREAR